MLEIPGRGRTLDGRVSDATLAVRPTARALGGREPRSNSNSTDSTDSTDDSSDSDSDLDDGVLLACGSRGWIAARGASTASPLYALDREHEVTVQNVGYYKLGYEPSHSVHRVVTSPCGRFFASCGEDGAVGVFDVADGERRARFAPYGGEARPTHCFPYYPVRDVHVDP